MVVPDILANAGGVTVSYFEWVQDLQNFFWEEDEINQRLDARWCARSRRCAPSAPSRAATTGSAAYLLAVARVADATEVRGIYP